MRRRRSNSSITRRTSCDRDRRAIRIASPLSTTTRSFTPSNTVSRLPARASTPSGIDRHDVAGNRVGVGSAQRLPQTLPTADIVPVELCAHAENVGALFHYDAIERLDSGRVKRASWPFSSRRKSASRPPTPAHALRVPSQAYRRASRTSRRSTGIYPTTIFCAVAGGGFSTKRATRNPFPTARPIC